MADYPQSRRLVPKCAEDGCENQSIRVYAGWKERFGNRYRSYETSKWCEVHAKIHRTARGERGAIALEMREQGKKFRQIAERLNVSASRARDIFGNAARKVASEGYWASRSGRGLDSNPYPPLTAIHRAWASAWRKRPLIP
jgi:hypothetical protein